MNHFTLESRVMLSNLLRHGKKYREISKRIDKSISSISVEIQKNGGSNHYDAYIADAKAAIRRRCHTKRTKLEKSLRLKEYVIQRLREDWSPDQIHGELKRLSGGKTILSHESIYLFVYSKEGQLLELWKHLRHRYKYMYPRRRSWNKRRKKGPTIPKRVSIHKRSAHIDTKGEHRPFGHWEADLMVFSKQKGVLVVFVERKTKQTFSFVNTNKGAKEMEYALHAFIEYAGVQNISSITFDNGLENVCHEEVRKEYAYQFCDPYSSWQKGLVENTNKLLRQYFPRNINPQDLTQENLDIALLKINNRPRKLLKYNTPSKSFNSCSF